MSRAAPTIAAAGLALAAAACQTGPAGGPADLVLRGGKVVTLDPTHPEAHAIAISGHAITTIGSDVEISRHIGPRTEVVELEGRLVIPGFIEGHGHFMGLGEARMTLDLTDAASWEEIVERVRSAAEEAEQGAWVRGHGWHQEKWTELPEPAVDGVPVHASLSAVTPHNPVILSHASGHASFVNGLALDAAGITRATPDPPGGTIVRDGRGEATGLLREKAQRLAWDALAAALEARGPEAVERDARMQVELAGEELLRKGVTTFHDAGVSFEVIDRYRRLAAQGSLPVRIYAMVRHESNQTMAEKLPGYRTVPEGNAFLSVRSIKRQIDGALGSHGAWMLEPYLDMPGTTGLVLETVEEIERTAEIALEHGYQLNTHAIGDRANREVLDLYQRAFAERADALELRWRIEHAQHLHPDDVPRFAELGVIASMQGVHCTSDGPWIPKRIGPERAREGAYVWRALIDSGALVTNGSDVPVEDVDPIASFYASVSRRSADGSAFFPEQSMTRAEALRSYTWNNAYAAFEEHLKGSLEPGKLADLVVLSRDILEVAEERIPDTRVDVTIVGGEVRYRRDSAE